MIISQPRILKPRLGRHPVRRQNSLHENLIGYYTGWHPENDPVSYDLSEWRNHYPVINTGGSNPNFHDNDFVDFPFMMHYHGKVAGTNFVGYISDPNNSYSGTEYVGRKPIAQGWGQVSTNFSFSILILSPNFGGTSNYCIPLSWESSNNSLLYGYTIALYNNIVRVARNNGTSQVNCDSNAVLVNNQWNHVVFTSELGTQRMWINGVSQGPWSYANPTFLDSTKNINVSWSARFTTTANTGTWYYRHMMYWSRTLVQSEVDFLLNTFNGYNANQNANATLFNTLFHLNEAEYHVPRFRAASPPMLHPF